MCVRSQVRFAVLSVVSLAFTAMSDAGEFVIVWSSFGQDGSGFGVFGQRFDSAGIPQGSEFQVNTFTNNDQNLASVAMDAAGNFVIAWQSEGSPGTDSYSSSIQARRYASDGSAVGDQFQVNTYTSSFQFAPAIAQAAGGEFVVAWTSNGSGGTDTSSYSIHRSAPPPAADRTNRPAAASRS